MNQAWENGKKISFGLDFGPYGTKSGLQIFFLKIWLRQSLEILVNYHHVQYRKNNDPILRKLTAGRRNWQTDGQTDESDFTGRCPNNFERPKKLLLYEV